MMHPPFRPSLPKGLRQHRTRTPPHTHTRYSANPFGPKRHLLTSGGGVPAEEQRNTSHTKDKKFIDFKNDPSSPY